MSAFLAVVFALVTYLLIRLLHLTASSCAPLVFVKDQSSHFVQSVLELCPILQQPYIPPLLWGKSGHIQTIAYAKMGRVSTRIPSGVRHSTTMPDGATMTFDIYEPHSPHYSGGEYCILICPGIGSSSESAYIRTLVSVSQDHGYTTAVMNHLGALEKIKLTSPRMFSYGGTEELHAVRQEVMKMHPHCNLILLGCSMGGNIVIKYLGERWCENQRGVLAAVSVCTGYDIIELMPMMKSWYNLAKGYSYVITANQKKIIRWHKKQLLTEQFQKAKDISGEHVFNAMLLSELDEAYSRRVHGYDSVDNYYMESSASHVMHKVQIPLLLVNAEDDPLVPTPLLEFARQAASKLPNCIFALTKHGGHLGYFETGWVRPHRITWMDRLIVEFSDCISKMHAMGTLPHYEDKTKATTQAEEGDNSIASPSASISTMSANMPATTTTTTEKGDGIEESMLKHRPAFCQRQSNGVSH